MINLSIDNCRAIWTSLAASCFARGLMFAFWHRFNAKVRDRSFVCPHSITSVFLLTKRIIEFITILRCIIFYWNFGPVSSGERSQMFHNSHSNWTQRGSCVQIVFGTENICSDIVRILISSHSWFLMYQSPGRYYHCFACLVSCQKKMSVYTLLLRAWNCSVVLILGILLYTRW